MRIFLSSIFLLLLLCCTNRHKVPADIMGIREIYPITWDLARADALLNLQSRDSAADLESKRIMLYEQVFSVHGTTRDEYRKSLSYYEANPEMLKLMMDSLRAYERRVLEAPVLIPATSDTTTSRVPADPKKIIRDSLKPSL